MTEKRAICLNCIDGRVQLPEILWIQEKYQFDYVDMITEPGMDGVLANPENSIDDIKRKIALSIDRNKAFMIFVVGHHDCRANPESEGAHKDHVHLGVKRLKSEFPDIEIKGFWINEKWAVETL